MASTVPASDSGRAVTQPAAIDEPATSGQREERHVLGHLLVAHEAAVEAAAAPAGEDLGRHLECVERSRAVGRAAVADVDALEGHVVGHDLARRGRGSPASRRRKVGSAAFGSMGPK